MIVWCFWCSHRTGSLVIGIWWIISSIYVIAIESSSIGEFKDYKEIRNLLIVSIALSALQILFASLLLVGILKKVPVLLKTWMIFHCVYLVIFILRFAVLLFSDIVSLSGKVKQLIHIGVAIHNLWFVYNYYKQMVDENNSISRGNLQGTSLGSDTPPLQSKGLPEESTTNTSALII